MRKNTTTINEAARKVLGITRDEYALCSFIHYRQADRRLRVGWCADAKHEIADFVGISRPGLYKMIDRLCAENLLCVDSSTGHIQVTVKWIDVNNACKQSLQNSVNKVDNACKQSLQNSVNKVTHNIEKELVRVKIEEREREPAPSENLPLKTEEKKDLKSAPPPPQYSPAKIETMEQAIVAASNWLDEHEQQKQFWISTARFSGDISQEVAKFHSHYWRESGQHHKCKTDPIRFFQDGFLGWLINSKEFNRSQQGPSEAAKPQRATIVDYKPGRAALFEKQKF